MKKNVTKAELLAQVDELTAKLKSQTAEIGSLRAMVSNCLNMTRELLRVELAEIAQERRAAGTPAARGAREGTTRGSRRARTAR